MGKAVLKHKDYLSDSTKKKILLSNKVNGALIIIFVTVLFIDLAAMIFSGKEFNSDFLRSVFVIVLCSLNLLLNYYGLFKLTRMLLVFLLPVLLIFTIPLTGRVLDEYYFWFPYLPVAGSVLPYFLFSDKKEKKWLFTTLGFYLLLSLFTNNILDFYATGSLKILPIVHENNVFYKLAPTLIFIFINMTLYYVFDLSRKTEKSLINTKNLLDKKNKELEIKNAELKRINATKNKFFHIIGHDLKSPVAQIIQIAELFDDRFDSLSETEKKRLIKALKESSAAEFKLLNNLFDWALTLTQEMAFNPAPLNLYSLVDETIQLLQKSAGFKNIQINNKVSKKTIIYADENMLYTILRNLISNAIKFTYHDGIIEIGSEEKEEGTEIYVQDNGKGILKEDAQKLFKIDERLLEKGTDNEKGTGFGLIISKEFVNYHKGEIRVESELNAGSKFIIFIPGEDVIKKK